MLIADVSAQWVQTNGPYTGDPVNVLACSGSRLLAGTLDGIFTSTDSGVSWHSTQVKNYPIAAITKYGGSTFTGGGNGIFLSTDDGETWSPMNSGLTGMGKSITSLAVSGSTVIAGTWQGVYVSTDEGSTWNSANSGLPISNGWTFRVVSLAISGRKVFAATQSGLFVSTDNCLTWAAADSSLANVYVNALAATDTIVVACTTTGTFVSTNGGSQWAPADSGMDLMGWEIHRFEIIGTSLLAATDKGTYLSTDRGTSWAPTNSSGIATSDVWALAGNGASLFAGTAVGEIYLSTDKGMTWGKAGDIVMPIPMSNHEFTSVGDTLFAGAGYAGVYCSSDKGASWLQVDHDLATYPVTTLAGDGNVILAGTYGGGIFLSTDNSATWSQASSGLPAPYAYATKCFALASDDTGGRHVYAATDSGIFVSTNIGQNWNCILGQDPSMGGPLSIAAYGGGVFVGYLGGIMRSTDFGSSWSRSLALNGESVRDLVTDGGNLYAGVSSGADVYGVYISTDNGTTWSSGRSGLPPWSDVNAVAVSGASLFAGTFAGVFLSTDGGHSWVPVSSGLADTSISTLAVNDGYLYAGTYYYNGVWKRPISEMVSAIGQHLNNTPLKFDMEQNYPNPFNPTTTIKFGLPKQSQVSLVIYDILGREVKELVNDKLQAGYYHFTWDATRFASGVYFYRIEAQSLSGDKKSFVEVKKLLLLK